MKTDIIPYHGPASGRLHPRIYLALVGLTLWLVLASWGFAGNGYTDYLLVVVSSFFFIAMAILWALWRVWRNQAPDAASKDNESFGDWAARDFDTWQDRVKGSRAAVEILLPIAAAAFGMTAFAIVLHVVAHHAA